MKSILMSRGSKQIVEICAQIKKGESVLIITEPKMITVAKSIAAAVTTVRAEVVISIIEPRSSDGEEPPTNVAEAMKNSNVFICAVHTSITHTKAVLEATQNGARGIMLTQFNDEMLIDSGVHADFESAAETCNEVAKHLEDAKEIYLTTKYGTELKMSAKGRKSNSMTGIVKPGQFNPIPTIEANVSPLEGTTNGTIVCNASIPYIGIGLLKEDVILKVENGMIIDIKGGYQADILRDNLKSKNDPNVYNIAEIGVGLNPECKFNGLMLEDEGVFGSVHIGIGSSITLGGNILAKCHYDLIMTGVTLLADEKVLIEDGNVLPN